VYDRVYATAFRCRFHSWNILYVGGVRKKDNARLEIMAYFFVRITNVSTGKADFIAWHCNGRADFIRDLKYCQQYYKDYEYIEVPVSCARNIFGNAIDRMHNGEVMAWPKGI
jgi:hypothetical protein